MKRYLVQHPFDYYAQEQSDKPAIYFQNERISYGDLYSFSNRLANCLKNNGVSRGDRVCLIMPRSTNFIKALLGVLKADAVYVPVDDKSALGRAAEIISDCTPSAIICDQETLALAEALWENRQKPGTIFVLGSSGGIHERDEKKIYEEQILRFTNDQTEYANIDTDIAYIIYTSGSTGRPKGVAVSHLNIFNYIDWALNYFDIKRSDNILSTSLFHFDMSVFDIYASLFSGCRMTIALDGMVVFPNRIMDLIEKGGVTIWKAASSVFLYFVKLRALKANRMNTLRQIIFSGEPFATKFLIEWMKTYPDKKFFNAYGPSECTGISTCYQVLRIPESPLEAIPIGKACANTEVFAVKKNGETAGVEEVGELCIRSSSVSAGYWNDMEKTEIAFIRDPRRGWRCGDRVYRTGDLAKMLPDGNFVFLGRIDEQVKILGYRVEIGEIERALLAIQGVEEGAVIPVGDEANEGIQLVGFVGSLKKIIDSEQVRTILREILPKYMVPTKICFLPQLPRNQNGKVDKRKLRDLWVTIQSEEK